MEKKPLNVEIGLRIREARERASMTREKLAELVDITPRFVADIERGSVGVSVPNLRRICEVLSVSSDKLLFGTHSKESINDKLALIGEDYLEIIEKTIQNQIELIRLAESKNT